MNKKDIGYWNYRVVFDADEDWFVYRLVYGKDGGMLAISDEPATPEAHEDDTKQGLLDDMQRYLNASFLPHLSWFDDHIGHRLDNGELEYFGATLPGEMYAA